MKKRSSILLANLVLLTGGFIGGYLYGKDKGVKEWIRIQEQNVREDSLLFERAELIARSKDGNSKTITPQENYEFLKALGVIIPEKFKDFKGRASYGIDYSTGEGVIWVEFDGDRIGSI